MACGSLNDLHAVTGDDIRPKRQRRGFAFGQKHDCRFEFAREQSPVMIAADDAEPLDTGPRFVPGDPPIGDPSFLVTDGSAVLLQAQDVWWFAGPQGGFHVYAATRSAGTR